ncbi:MAG: hypothetical protein J3Q66DRAFT_428108, partial [Benniella sp.]
ALTLIIDIVQDAQDSLFLLSSRPPPSHCSPFSPFSTMLRSFLSPITFPLLTFTIVLFTSLCPFVLAQDFRPQPNSDTCYTYTEGQGLYILGGRTKENFMLDLSVSWNTSDPVFRKLSGGPKVDKGACAMTNNGEDLFVLTKGTGYVYNVKSSTWSVFHNANFGTSGDWQVAATDPGTGFIYFPTYGMNFTGTKVMLSVDLKTNTVNTTSVYGDPGYFRIVTWSAYLKRIVMSAMHYHPNTFAPSNISSPDGGWSSLPITNIGLIASSWNCAVAAYNGTKLFYIGSDYNSLYAVYIMDVVKLTWKRGPLAPKLSMSACAVTGDQLIVWGGFTVKKSKTITFHDQNRTHVFNMKTEKWVSSFTAPLRPATTTHTLQPSQTQAQHAPYTTATPESGNAPSGDMKLVTIIVIVTGTLMSIILGSIFRYHKRTRQFNSCDQRTNPDGSSTDSLDIKDDPNISVKDLSKGSSRRRDPSDSGSDSIDRHGESKWYMNGLLGRIHQGSLGARPLSEHPHATVEDPTTKRNVQEGALEIQTFSQHPHAAVDQETFYSNHGDKAMRKHVNGYGDKEELEDQ